ncbi:MAG: HPF/RaiA family ribosome-associated protein [Candidatus Kuenenbacteria bacterium]
MLNISFSFKNLSLQDKNIFEKYFPKKLERFDNLMKRFKDQDCHLAVRAEKFATKAAYVVELTLHIPRHKLMAKEDDHTIVEAVDLAVDKLIIQLRKLVNKNWNKQKKNY